jgi:hypothetical protein
MSSARNIKQQYRTTVPRGGDVQPSPAGEHYGRHRHLCLPISRDLVSFFTNETPPLTTTSFGPLAFMGGRGPPPPVASCTRLSAAASSRGSPLGQTGQGRFPVRF